MNRLLLVFATTILFLGTKSSWAQYCLPTYSYYCTSSDYINNFSTTGGSTNIVNTNSGCNGSAPNNYVYNSSMVVTAVVGDTINFSVQAGSIFSQGFRIWVDWNQNNSFADAGEAVWASASSSTSVFTGKIGIPSTASIGTTRMRVLCRYASVPSATDYCATNMNFGECEDYNFTVIGCSGFSAPPSVSTLSSDSVGCPGNSLSLSFNKPIQNNDPNITFQWESAPSAAGPWAVIATTNAPNYVVPNFSTATCYRGKAMCYGIAPVMTAAPACVGSYPGITLNHAYNGPVCQGDSIKMSVNKVSGYTYGWYKNGYPVAGATDTVFYAKSSGVYQCRATVNGAVCFTKSDTVSVEIVELPIPALAYQGALEFCEGGSIVLSAIGAPNIAYQWLRNGVPIINATDSFYEVKTSGSYAVSVISAIGCKYTSSSVPITVYPNPKPPIVRNGLVLSSSIFYSYQWYKNNLPINGANAQAYTVTEPGSYLLEVTTPDGCINRSDLIVLTTLSTSNIVNNKVLKLYPNPTRNMVNIVWPNAVNVIILNATGQAIKTLKNVNQVDMEQLAAGAYMLLITDSDNEFLAKEKVIKHD